jgi:tRNA-specific 2-thiouridylase
VRAHGEEVPAVAELVAADAATPYVRVELAAPMYGVAPGQAIVLYDGTRVVGSATVGGSH